MNKYNYIYSFKYDVHNIELCKLESRQLFGEEENRKMLFSNAKVNPSISPFIKNRFEIISTSNEYADLLTTIRKENICIDGFKVEYLLLDGDDTDYTKRLEKLRDVGYCIDGDPDYNNPSVIYSICKHHSIWYFGVLIKHNSDWFKHKNKPRSFSSSLNIDIAKSMVSLATQGNTEIELLDACCGVGTVMLEACISGFKIDGCDIHWRACHAARENIAHYGYTANVYRSDIKDIDKKYDAAIVDLPYNLYCVSDDTVTSHIINSVAKLAHRMIIVSSSDIVSLIKNEGYEIVDFCTVGKKGKKFTRNIWVCTIEN